MFKNKQQKWKQTNERRAPDLSARLTGGMGVALWMNDNGTGVHDAKIGVAAKKPAADGSVFVRSVTPLDQLDGLVEAIAIVAGTMSTHDSVNDRLKKRLRQLADRLEDALAQPELNGEATGDEPLFGSFG